MATTKNEPKVTEPVEDTEEVSLEEMDPVLVAVIMGPKAKAIKALAEIRNEYVKAEAIAKDLKVKHDSLVKVRQTMRGDFADVARIESRGRKSKDTEVSAEVSEPTES
jgi:hypothetical protein